MGASKNQRGEINLENVFENISLTTNDFKLRNFQYKLLHRILPTNMFLVKIGIKYSDLCNFCNNATDSILHYIWLCPIIKVFWQQVIVLLPRNLWNTNVSIELNKRNTVFNTNIEEFPLEIIHFILLFTKYYIHCCKWSDHLPTIETLKCKLKSREQIEKIYAFIDRYHHKTWNKLVKIYIVLIFIEHYHCSR